MKDKGAYKISSSRVSSVSGERYVSAHSAIRSSVCGDSHATSSQFNAISRSSKAASSCGRMAVDMLL